MFNLTYDKTILIKVDRSTKRSMSNIEVNWSELIREFIKKEINRKQNIARAERLRSKLFRTKRGLESTTVIRSWRDSRYGPGSS